MYQEHTLWKKHISYIEDLALINYTFSQAYEAPLARAGFPRRLGGQDLLHRRGSISTWGRKPGVSIRPAHPRGGGGGGGLAGGEDGGGEEEEEERKKMCLGDLDAFLLPPTNNNFCRQLKKKVAISLYYFCCA